MNVIPLDSTDLFIAASLLILLALISYKMRLGIGNRMLISGCRMTVQLLLVGLVLRTLFESYNLWFLGLLSCAMILVAGREVLARQRITVKGKYSYGVSIFSMFISSFTLSYFCLTTIIEVDPWYTPQYAIPLLGMLLGNTMTGISIATDRLTTDIYDHRDVIEQRLFLGESWQEACEDVRKNSMRTGMIPIINSMAAAGIVSLPGTMTGQILGGAPPLEAVKYQILIFFLIASGTGFGIVFSIWLTNRNLFDKRHRLCLENMVES